MQYSNSDCCSLYYLNTNSFCHFYQSYNVFLISACVFIFQLQFGSFHKVTVEMVFKALLILLLKYIYNSDLSFSLVTNGHKKMAMVTNFCLEIDFKKVKGNDWIFCK